MQICECVSVFFFLSLVYYTVQHAQRPPTKRTCIHTYTNKQKEKVNRLKQSVLGDSDESQRTVKAAQRGWCFGEGSIADDAEASGH